MRFVILVIFLVGGLVAAFLGYGRERTWATLFGPADLGPVSFADLRPPATPNQFLVCPPETCTRTTPGLVAPVFATDPARLRQELDRIIRADPHTELVATDNDRLGDRYVQRTAWLRLPDTIVVRYIPLDFDRTTLAIYSRSKVGSNDFGANEARVRRWLAALERVLPAVAAA